MKNLSISTKVIIPVFIIAIFTSLISFYYINNILENVINSEIQEKIQTKINYTKNYIESEHKLLLGLKERTEESSKKNAISSLRENSINSNDILYIVTPDENIQISPRYLPRHHIESILKTNPFTIDVSGTTYQVIRYSFSPWDWKILLLVDKSKVSDILQQNLAIISTIVMILLGALFIILILIFNYNIIQPINKIFSYLGNVTKGEYKEINESFHSKELDQLVTYLNSMTKAVETREVHAQDLLKQTKENEDYIYDILDSQENIILVYDKNEIKTANKSFFKLLKDYKDIDDFKKQHHCISEYFQKEEGLIYDFEDINWMTYVQRNKKTLHRVKIKINDIEYIYALNVIQSEKYPRVIVSLTDITELQRNTTLLSEYKKAVDSAAIVSKTDKDGFITYVNDEFVNISGYSKEELIGQKHNILRSPNMPNELFDKLWETITSKNIWHGELENINKSGEKYYVAASIVPILDADQNITEYMGIRYEITDQVIAKERALQAEQARGLFLANMSHEIRTPLNAIIGFTKILNNMPLEKKSSQYINIIDKSAQSLLGIVNDILDLSKIETNNLTLEKINFNPFEEFDSVINLFTAKVNEKNLQLIYFIDPKIPQQIIGDPLRLKQVLSNLISNAVKFTNEGYIKIRIELLSFKDKKCSIRFIVQDTGIGIKKEKQQQVFSAFSQADNSISREFGGTGLGLSISSKIIQAYDTAITLESEENKGSKFSFDIDFETNSSNNEDLDKYKKIKTAIYQSKNMNQLALLVLEEYLDLITLNSKIDINEKENIQNQDIVFIAQDAIDELKDLNNENTKFVVLSNNNKEIESLNNYEILNLPINLSILFEVLLESMNKDEIIHSKRKKETYNKYKAKILIVEDHEINQELISILLELRGVEYKIANNGQEAIDMFKIEDFDMILMDINMPIKNGIDASIEIMEFEKEKDIEHTPIVVLSANAIHGEKEQILSLGIDDYLYKPINEKRLDEVLSIFLKDEDTNYEEVKVNYDMNQASSQMGLPLQTLQTIVKKFIKNVDNDLEKLEKAIVNKNQEDTKIYSHKIRGAALNFRMDDIASYCATIEKNYDNTNLDLQKELNKLKKAIEQVKQTINS